METALPALAEAWLPAERAALRPTERLCPSDWAEKHRVLTRMQSARPGPWRNDHAPYLAGLMDLCANRGVEELTIVKGAQIGVSEALRNVVGYYAHQEPDPILLVLPDEQSGRKIVAQRIVPLLRDTPSLRQLFTPASRDIQLRHVTLANGFTLRLGWSGSPASLASDPCRIVINDEVDKFQPFSGREADPISLGYARTQSYEGRRLIVNVSTPTTAEGLIWRRYESASIHMHFAVACPLCGEYQKLVFGNLRWKKYDYPDAAREAAAIENERAAWYECSHCRGEISEGQRAAMIRGGRWIADSQTIDRNGIVQGEMPPGRRIGAHIWAAYCLWIPLYRIAAEFIRCKSDPIALMGFTNSWLAEPFRSQVVHVKTSEFEEKAAAATAYPRTVPVWARCLIATADTQKASFYWVVRAWGADYRSQRVDHGVALSFEELRRRTLDAEFPWESGRTGTCHVQILGIDSGGTGNRTNEVYRFALTDPARIRATKGASREGDLPVVTRRVSYRPPGGEAPFPVYLTLISTGHFKDRLAHAITARQTVTHPRTGEVMEEVDQWTLNTQCDPDYNRQMASEHKVLIRRPGGGQAETWIPISSGAANHYWDAEVLQFAMADVLRVDTATPYFEGETELRESERAAARARRKAESLWYLRERSGRTPFRRRY